MDSLLFHPKLVHLPIALAVLMPLVALGFGIAWWKSWLPARAWVVVVALQAVLVASGLLAMRSGETEEERVESVVAESAIHAHEEAAEVFVWSGVAVLAVMGAGLVLGRRKHAAAVATVAATAGAIAVLALGYRVGEAGGALVYRDGAASAYVAGGGSAPVAGDGEGHERGGEHEDDDD